MQKINSLDLWSRCTRPSQWLPWAIWCSNTNDPCFSGRSHRHRSRMICVGMSGHKDSPTWAICWGIRPQRIWSLCSWQSWDGSRWINIDMQVNYICTCLNGKAQEWFHWSIEHFNKTGLIIDLRNGCARSPEKIPVHPVIPLLQHSSARHKDCSGNNEWSHQIWYGATTRQIYVPEEIHLCIVWNSVQWHPKKGLQHRSQLYRAALQSSLHARRGILVQFLDMWSREHGLIGQQNMTCFWKIGRTDRFKQTCLVTEEWCTTMPIPPQACIVWPFTWDETASGDGKPVKMNFQQRPAGWPPDWPTNNQSNNTCFECS